MVRSSLFWAGTFVSLCYGQQAGWIDGQVNTTMCYWTSPRAAVVRDTYYVDGGQLYWEPGMNDGSYADPVDDGNPLGIVYLLNFSIPFKVSDNISSVFTTISKGSNGGAASNIGPTYVDGAMLANDYEWYTYGGLLGVTDAFSEPDDDAAATYQVYESGPPKQFIAGFATVKLPSDLTRYVTYGGAVSIPSENLGYYFAGLRAADFGEIYLDPGPSNASYNADVLSSTLVSIDMTSANEPNWSNESLPSTVPGRAAPEIAWVPVSEQGVLIAIGGVIDPSYVSLTQSNNASIIAKSGEVSPGFMTNVSVYDISKKVWYEQQTSGTAPGALNQGCTVVASAEDGSSHNIYWYGGYDGNHPTQTFSDDVFVLSIPSFIWTRVYAGNNTHGRAGHRCVKPYPDQMFVVGGYASLSGNIPSCLEDGLIQIFNLSDPGFLDSYDPTVWSNYTVPSTVTDKIGGTGTGGASQSTPSGGFGDSDMEDLFGSAYNTSKITNWYPYTKTETTPPNNRTTILPTVVASKKSGTPSYLAPVLGVVLGLFFITILILAFILFRRRRILGLSGTATQSELGTAVENRRRTLRWLYGTPAVVVGAKAPTVTTDEMTEVPISSEPDSDRTRFATELQGETQFHELGDTSRPVELATGFVPISSKSNIHNNISRSPADTGMEHSASAASRTSTVSRSSGMHPSPTSPARADSLTLNEGAGRHPRITSDLSSVAESDRLHLRQISDSSVSVDGDMYGVSPPNDGARSLQNQQQQQQGVISPLTPPQRVGEEGNDFLGARAASGNGQEGQMKQDTRRKSNFEENLDE